jgi:hypothetical protein
MLERLLTRCHESANNAMALAAAVKKAMRARFASRRPRLT